MAKKKIAESRPLDITAAENQRTIQVADIRLISSDLTPLSDDEQVKESRFVFTIDAVIDDHSAYSQMQVEVTHIGSQETSDFNGYFLRFNLLGIFIGSEEATPEDLAEFARMYTLTILWPYAREYTGDQLRRAGVPFDSLPIINPQVITEKLLTGDFISVKILSPASTALLK